METDGRGIDRDAQRWVALKALPRATEAANSQGAAVLREIFFRGPKAKAAIPAVMAVMVHTKFRRHEAVTLAKQALESIGVAAVPALLEVLKLKPDDLEGRSDEAPENAAEVLGYIHPITEEVVRALKAAAETSPFVSFQDSCRKSAIHALWKMYPAVLEFFPDFESWVVERCEQETQCQARTTLAWLIGDLQPEGDLLARAVEQLGKWVRERSGATRFHAARTLTKVGEAGRMVLRTLDLPPEDYELVVAIRRAQIAQERKHPDD